jgi:DNA-binding CsgD family transcriptional regulator
MAGRPKSPKAASITRAIKKGDSDSAIAARLGVARSTVREYRRHPVAKPRSGNPPIAFFAFASQTVQAA